MLCDGLEYPLGRLLSHSLSWTFFLIFFIFSLWFPPRSLFTATLTTSEHLCVQFQSVSGPTYGNDGVFGLLIGLFLFLFQSSQL
jgi:hypothetical protein